MLLGVDLEYPKELNDLYNNYPLAPKKLRLKNICCLIIGKRLWKCTMFHLVRLKSLFLIYLTKNNVSYIKKT